MKSDSAIESAFPLHTTFFSAQDDEMRRTTISHFSFLIQAKLSSAIKGRYAPGTNPEPVPFHLTNLFECGKIIKSLEERWFFEN